MSNAPETILYPVKDIAAAKARFGALFGVDPYMDEVYYCAFNVAGQDVGLDPQGHAKGMTGPVPYWRVEDLNASLKSLLDAGGETVQDIKDVGGGKLVAS